MSTKVNLYADQGTDFRTTIELFDGDNDELGISTYTFFSDIRKVYSETKKASFDIETANNDVTLVLTANTTSNLTPGKYQYDVLMRKQSGELSKIVDGLIYILPTMTEVS
jgi:hypothetical protein